MFKDSKFHCALHKWALVNKNKPLFHIDIHGKKNRKNNADLDLGTMPMEENFWDKELWFNLTEELKKGFDKAFKGIKIRKFKPKCECNPSLHGLWGGDLHTISN